MAGGYDNTGNTFPETELLDLATQKWQLGPALAQGNFYYGKPRGKRLKSNLIMTAEIEVVRLLDPT